MSLVAVAPAASVNSPTVFEASAATACTAHRPAADASAAKPSVAPKAATRGAATASTWL